MYMNLLTSRKNHGDHRIIFSYKF